MRKAMFLLTGLFVLLAFPSAAPAGCIKAGSFDSFTLVRDGTVILNSGGAAAEKVETNCIVYEKSGVRLFKNYFCNGDDIMIGDKTCNMASVSSAEED